MTNPGSPPLAPVSIPSRQNSPSKTPSLLSPSTKASSSSISIGSPPNNTSEISASDKEREKLLYLGRVLLTSKSLQFRFHVVSLTQSIQRLNLRGLRIACLFHVLRIPFICAHCSIVLLRALFVALETTYHIFCIPPKQSFMSSRIKLLSLSLSYHHRSPYSNSRR